MNEHYYTKNPISEVKEKTFTSIIKDRSLEFTSVSGVFSFNDRIDKASLLLIKNFNPSGQRVLDLGCGYGAIGLYLKALFSTQDIWMSDINARAIEYTQINAKRNHLLVNALQSDLFSAMMQEQFNDIVSNPPIAAGKILNTTLIHEAHTQLLPEGALWLVAFHNKGGATLKEIMKTIFGNVQDIEKSGGMRVYKSIKNLT